MSKSLPNFVCPKCTVPLGIDHIASAGWQQYFNVACTVYNHHGSGNSSSACSGYIAFDLEKKCISYMINIKDEYLMGFFKEKRTALTTNGKTFIIDFIPLNFNSCQNDLQKIIAQFELLKFYS